MKDYVEAVRGFVGDFRVMLFATVGSAVLLFFPEKHTPPDIATFIAGYRGWIWGAFVLGLTGLVTRTLGAIATATGGGLRTIYRRWKRDSDIDAMGALLRSLPKEEAALASMFPSVHFNSLVLESNHPVTRSLRYRKIIEYHRSPILILRHDGFSLFAMTEDAQSYLERNPDTFAHLDRNEALNIANCIMETPMEPYQGARRRDDWRR
jgi:hypothetical protein